LIRRNFPAPAEVFSLGGGHSEKMMLRGFFKAVLVVVLVYAAGFVLFVMLLPRAPAQLPSADAIVALTGGDARLDAAVAMFEKGTGKRLLISGVGIVTTKRVLKHLTHGARRFDCCADIGYTAEDTRGNADEAAAWTRAHHYKSLVIVTASYHMPRALCDFHAAMPHVKLVPYPVESSRINLNGWWHRSATIRALHSEYAKYLASRVLTTLSPGTA
jgi:uncharacterized SAM-binding protein YcdF (DUF218 family)